MVQTDASDRAISAVLAQEDEEGQEYAVAYYSKKLNPTQERYSTVEKEMLSIISTLRNWKHYLLGKRFLLITDNRALTFLHKMKETNSKLFRWSLDLQEFDMEVKHRTSSQNSNADALSRREFQEEIALADLSTEEEEVGVPQLKLIPSLNQFDIRDAQLEDAELLPLIKEIRRSGPTPSHFLSSRGALYKRTIVNKPYEEELIQLVIPATKREQVISLYHNPPLGGHQSTEKMVSIMTRQVVWNQMAKDVKKFVKSCLRCNLANQPHQRKKAPMIPSEIPEKPFTRLGLDLIGPLPIAENGARYLFVATDLLTKYAIAVPMQRPTAEETAKIFVEDIVMKYGVPTAVISDQGSNFTSDLFRQVCRVMKIKHIKTTPYHPQSNGQTERTNGILVRLMRTLIEDDQVGRWTQYVAPATFLYNSAVQRSTRASPFFLLYGRTPNLMLDFCAEQPFYMDEPSYADIFPRTFSRILRVARQQIECAQMKQQKYRAKREEGKILEKGDFVTVDRQVFPPGVPIKFFDKRVGPFIVEKVFPNSNYSVRKLEGSDTYRVHADRLVKIPPFPFYHFEDLNLKLKTTSSSQDVNKPRTRSQGAATEQPHVMDKPLEYK